LKAKATYKYRTIHKIQGPLVFLRSLKEVAYGEIVKIIMEDGEIRRGQVLQADNSATIIQVFEGTESMESVETTVEFSRDVFKVGLVESMLGRTMNGLGEPVDNKGSIIFKKRSTVIGNPLNPIERHSPDNFIETGFSVIDGMNSLVQGQKLPIFTVSGTPTSEIAAKIALNARILGSGKQLDIVFVALGITEREGKFFSETFEQALSSNIAFFVNFTMDSIVERILTPHVALTFAEYLAFELEHDVLVIMHDMLNYCEALREISTYRKEFPGRRGFPGYLYTDLATIYERAGVIKGKQGSVTMLPVLTMPNDDITHPVPDLTGYITEGQLIVSRDLTNRELFPPINPQPSLSRLMNEGIGKDKTREDHSQLANQLFAAYAHGNKLKQLASIAGVESLSSRDQQYLEFVNYFEENFINQTERRTIIETLDIGWQCLTKIPKSALNRIKKEIIKKYYPKKR
jgi:V/A-type H+-transporting ATPase subunit B